MAVTFVGAAASPAENLATHTVTIPAAAQAGDVALLITGYQPGFGTPAFTGWTLHATQAISTSGDSQMWSKVLAAGEPGTDLSHTFTNLQRATFAVAVFRGTNGVDAVSSAAVTALATTHPSAPVTLTAPGHVVAGYMERTGTPSSTITAPTGFTEVLERQGVGTGATGVCVAWDSTEDTAGSQQPGNWTNAPSTTRAATWTVGLATTATGVTGTLAATLDPVTASFSATHTPPVTGTLAATLDPVTAAMVATHTPPTITGTLSATLDPVTAAFTANHIAPVEGTIAATLAPVTASMSVTHTPPAITGTLAATLDPVTASMVATHTPPNTPGTIGITWPTVTVDARLAGTVDVAWPTITIDALEAP